jgi:hypothetical protein
MNHIHHEISPSGQIVEVKVTKNVLSNADSMIQALVEQIQTGDESMLDQAETPQQAIIKSFHALGDGVCAFQRIGGSQVKTYGGILIEDLPFYTNWQLEKVDGGDYYLRPFNGTDQATPIELGAPLIMNVPGDLVIHFFVEWTHSAGVDLVMPEIANLKALPELFRPRNVSNYYLTCFSKKRNTCVRLPLPNLYDDAHLCTGSSFGEAWFAEPMAHSGIVRSVKSYAKSWKATAWNNDLLGGATSDRTRQYHKFVRFSADDGRYIGSSACLDWPVGSSPVPLEEVYAPWFNSSKIPPQAEPEVVQAEAGRPPEPDGMGGFMAGAARAGGGR